LLVAAAANVDDFDDADIETLTHPTSVNLAAAVAAASVSRAKANDFLSAVAIGCELELRLARALSPSALDRGWDLNGVVGAISSAVVTALLVSPTQEVVLGGIGIGASSTLGQLNQAGTMLKPFVIGKAAANGVSAALLSDHGFTSSATALEAVRGLGQALTDRRECFDDAAASFGHEWLLEQIIVKRYPCGIVLHPAIDAALQLRRGDAWRTADSFTVRCHPLSSGLISRQPGDPLQAKLSAAYCVAAALRDGGVDLRHFGHEAVLDCSYEGRPIHVVSSEALRLPEVEIAALKFNQRGGSEALASERSTLKVGLEDSVMGKARRLLGHYLPDQVDSLVEGISRLDRDDDVQLIVSAVGR
jgi:2-methylcitrate dehydratase PrpD